MTCTSPFIVGQSASMGDPLKPSMSSPFQFKSLTL
jgi:hypothetical protein